MAQTNRQYECIVFGATGYTGKYTCEVGAASGMISRVIADALTAHHYLTAH